MESMSDEEFKKNYIEMINNPKMKLKDFAKECGVSRQTIQERRNRLNLPHKKKYFSK